MRNYILQSGDDDVRRDKLCCGYFRVPAILFDRGIFPKRLGLSEDAFKLFLLECSCVKDGGGTHFAGQPAARNYLGLSEEAYLSAQKELKKNGYVYRYYPKQNKRNLTYWCIANPQLVKIDLDGTFSLVLPSAEPQKCLSAAFHHGKTPFDFVRVPNAMARRYGADGDKKIKLFGLQKAMTTDEIMVYVNLLWQNREAFFGLNPNYVRSELSLGRGPIDGINSLESYLTPSIEFQDKLWINPVLVDRTGLSEAEIGEIITRLVYRHGLLEWKFWIAESVTYKELRRSKEMHQLMLRWYLSCDYGQVLLSEVVGQIRQIVNRNKRFQLIGQLRSSFHIEHKFETIIKRNCENLSFTKVFEGQGDIKEQGVNEVKVTSPPVMQPVAEVEATFKDETKMLKEIKELLEINF